MNEGMDCVGHMVSKEEMDRQTNNEEEVDEEEEKKSFSESL